MIKMPKFTLLLLASIVLSISSSYSGAQSNVTAALDRLLQSIKTLQADVTQLIVESDGGILEESQIRMYLKKPDGFYWETIDPFPELIVTNGIKLWNYQPDLEQVVIEDWDSGNSELAAQLLSGQIDNLESEYTIEQVSESSSELDEFQLSPLASDSIYKLIRISFFDKELDSIYLNNKNGQQTVWRFANVQRNQPLADSLFEFDPPDNIEVIENSYVQ